MSTGYGSNVVTFFRTEKKAHIKVNENLINHQSTLVSENFG